MLFPVLNVVILNRLFFKNLFGDDTSFLTHGFVLQIKLCVFNSINRLLFSLSHKHLWEDIFKHKDYGLVASFLAWLQLFLLDFKLGPGFYFLFLRLFSEGCTQVWLVVIRILPKLPVEYVPFLLNSTLLPVLCDYVIDYLLAGVTERLVRVLIEPLCHLSWLGVLIQKCDFF
jgi:hypothetical protein